MKESIIILLPLGHMYVRSYIRTSLVYFEHAFDSYTYPTFSPALGSSYLCDVCKNIFWNAIKVHKINIKFHTANSL